MIKFIRRLLCRHWFLPKATGTFIQEIGDRREETPIFDPLREECVFCGKIKFINKNHERKN